MVQIGLIKNCYNSGAVEGDGADYIGGIAGGSEGYIRSCNVKCEITGDTYVGGISGAADIVTDCVSVVAMEGYTERVGAIIGPVEEREEVARNYYLVSGKDIGAIDGISYNEVARALELDALLALEGIPEEFAKNKIEFMFENGTIQTVLLTPGENLKEADVPSIPAKSGYRASWKGLDSLIVNFDKVYEIEYVALETIVESKERGYNDRPLLLIEGKLGEEAEVFTKKSTVTCIPSEKQTLVDEFKLVMTEVEGTIKVRYQLPKDYDSKHLHLFVWHNDQWNKTAYEVDGSYMLFDVETDNVNIAIIYQRTFEILDLILVGAGILLLLIILIAVLVRRGKAKRQAKRERKAAKKAAKAQAKAEAKALKAERKSAARR